jgi:hypothetical protein
MTQVKQHLKEATYDIETNHRIEAHLIYKQLQADAKQASQSFTVEGFPKDASTADKHAFIKWILESSSCADPDVKASLTNTKGEVSNTGPDRADNGSRHSTTRPGMETVDVPPANASPQATGARQDP